MMALIANVANGDQRFQCDLALEGEHVVFSVRNYVAIVEVGIGADGNDARKVERSVGIFGGDTVRRESQRERIPVLRAVGGVDEGLGETGWLGAQVVVAKRGHCVHHACGQARKGGVEDPVTCANAAFAAGPKNVAENATIEIWRVGQAEAWSKIVGFRCTDSSGDARVTRN